MIVRAIVPDDEAAYRSILEDTSPEDRYCRFFHQVDHFDPEEVHRFVEARDDMLGVIAEEGGVAFGAAHAALLDATSAELGIVVSQSARKRGVGSALLTALVAELKQRGFDRLVAVSLRENHAFDKLARRARFTVERVDGDALWWVLLLAEVPAAAAV
jgi:GNAT superfamily N-acetyltransferase